MHPRVYKAFSVGKKMFLISQNIEYNHETHLHLFLNLAPLVVMSLSLVVSSQF